MLRGAGFARRLNATSGKNGLVKNLRQHSNSEMFKKFKFDPARLPPGPTPGPGRHGLVPSTARPKLSCLKGKMFFVGYSALLPNFN